MCDPPERWTTRLSGAARRLVDTIDGVVLRDGRSTRWTVWCCDAAGVPVASTGYAYSRPVDPDAQFSRGRCHIVRPRFVIAVTGDDGPM